MQLVITIALCVLFLALSSVHVFWALKPNQDLTAFVPLDPSAQGPAFVPGVPATLAVAVALGLAAVLVATQVTLALWVMAAVFALRAFGDFKYCGITKRIKTTRFARNDTRFFTPLCAAVSAALAFIAL